MEAKKLVEVIKLGLDLDIAAEIMARATKQVSLGADGKDQMASLIEQRKAQQSKQDADEIAEAHALLNQKAAYDLLAAHEMVSLADLVRVAKVEEGDYRKFINRLRKYVAANIGAELLRTVRRGEVMYCLKAKA